MKVNKKEPPAATTQSLSINALLDVMAQLRDPDGGCPWDLVQNFKTIAPYTIEEAYEVADAIDRGDMDELREELGDLLLQVVYHAQMAKEQDDFDFDDVVQAVTNKMIHRHPHVFGGAEAQSAGDVEQRIWEERKDMENKRTKAESVLDDVPRNFPALKRAQKLQKRAARLGFEWNETAHVLDKLEEEIAELREALASGREEDVTDELGDIFFVLTNFGRMLGQDCEEALRQANNKFERRFRGMEIDSKNDDKDFSALTLDEKEEYWQRQKRKEK